MSIATDCKNDQTHPILFKAWHEPPSAIELPIAMQNRDLGPHLLQVHLRLLRLLTQELDGPFLALADEYKEHIEQLVARRTRHAFVLALCPLVLCTL
jgi:hypothetical protein